MRRVVITALCLLVLVGSPVPATGALPSAAPTDIAVTILVDAPYPVAGETRSEYATLLSDGSPVAGETLELWVKYYGHNKFVFYDSATTDSNGSANIPLTAWHNVHYQWRYQGSLAYLSSRSDKLPRNYSTLVRAKPRTIQVKRGEAVVFRGRTRPAKPGFEISLWRGTTTRGGWYPGEVRAKQLKVGQTRADGTFRIAFRFHKVGRKRLFIEVPRGLGNILGWSPYLHIRVV